MIEYETNPNVRCARCNGRLVIAQSDDGSQEVNLFKKNGLFFCKDSKECDRNIKAEDTTFDIEVGEDTLKIKCNGHDIIEVQKK